MTLSARQLYVWAFVIAVPAFADDSRRFTFEDDIRTILRTHCLDCHGAETEKEGNLDLRLVRFALQGGDSGPALVAHDPDASRIIQRVRAGEMPPGKGKVSSAELAKLEEWIRQGALTKKPEPQSIPDGLGVSTEDRQWWAFQPIRSPDVPAPITDNHLADRSTFSLLRTFRPVFLSLLMPRVTLSSSDSFSISSACPQHVTTSNASSATRLPMRSRNSSTGRLPPLITASDGPDIGSTWWAMPILKEAPPTMPRDRSPIDIATTSSTPSTAIFPSTNSLPNNSLAMNSPAPSSAI